MHSRRREEKNSYDQQDQERGKMYLGRMDEEKDKENERISHNFNKREGEREREEFISTRKRRREKENERCLYMREIEGEEF